jgi:spore germination protein YaaH
MSSVRVRLACALACAATVVLSAAGPVAAADPFPPSVHAEMLEEHAADDATFTPGSAPQPFVAPAPDRGTVTQEGGAGGIAALPNGLSHEVFGYLPYWSLSSGALANLDYDRVSTIAYFSVGARKDGTLAKTSGGVATTGWAGWTSSAMTGVITAAHQHGVKVVLTVTMMAWDGDYRDMTALLANRTNRIRLAGQIAKAVKARSADGVNLDFEPMPNSLESHYTRFVRTLKADLVARGAGSYLTVATTGGAASWNEGYELVDNADADTVHLLSSGSADALMVMGYDFNWSGSARAGGVAPIQSPYILDVKEAMAAYLARVPASRIIWGVPYYGRSWTTTSKPMNSLTCASAGGCRAASWASTYVNARDAAATHGRRWDAAGAVPWYRYHSATYGTWVQGYYDDAASLTVKYDLVKANRVRGIGIWHLLMDGSRRELWDTIAIEFGPPPFTDIGDTKFAAAIAWVYQRGIMAGCSATKFCPTSRLTRGQLASALADGLNLPATGTDFFSDDESSPHESDINRLAAAGAALGCGGSRFCPGAAVRRDHLATMLANAFDLPATSRDYFSDDDGSRHEPNINRIAAAGITSGCGGGRYCTSSYLNRGQGAAFLRNAFD